MSDISTHNFEPAFNKQTMNQLEQCIQECAEADGVNLHMALEALTMSYDVLRKAVQDKEGAAAFMKAVLCIHETIEDKQHCWMC